MGSYSDPIAEMLNKIRTALSAKKKYVDVNWSKIKEEMVKILKEEGFLSHYLVKDKDKKGVMRIFLKYDTHLMPWIQQLERISKPSRRVFFTKEELSMHQSALILLSTSRGVMGSKQARELGIGGEALCKVG